MPILEVKFSLEACSQDRTPYHSIHLSSRTLHAVSCIVDFIPYKQVEDMKIYRYNQSPMIYSQLDNRLENHISWHQKTALAVSIEHHHLHKSYNCGPYI